MSDKVTICNMAAGHIRAGSIQTFEENSILAGYCRLFYDSARKATLERYDWSFARQRYSLNLLTESAPDTWLYRYSYPPQSIKARYIAYPGSRRPRVPIPFEIELDASGNNKTILTDMPDAILVHTVDVENVALFTPSFEDAVSWRLAAYLAVPMAGRPDDEKRCFDWWQFITRDAETFDANEGQQDEEPDGEFVEARY